MGRSLRCATMLSCLCLLFAAVASGQSPASVDPAGTPSSQSGPSSSSTQNQATPNQQLSSAPQLNPTQEVASEVPQGPALDVGPAKLRIGGYLGLTGIYRSTNGGGGTGTSFAAIPYGDTLRGNVSETRLTAQASRITLRVDADFPEARPRFRKLAGYFEMDFNGSVSGTFAVTSTSAGFRLRHAFLEVQYSDSFYMGAGQAFSLMTPQKDQISMWPSDVEISQAVDTNYLAGTVWGRIPQFRLAWRPSKRFNWAFSLENPEQQLGRSLVTLPSCCASELDAQYNTGSDELNVPNRMPDFITRVVFNPTPAVHVDVGGVLRAFRHTITPYNNEFTATGGGGNINGSVRVSRNTKVLGQFAAGPGIGRYMGGLVPDVAFGPDSSINPINTISWVAGVEQKLNSTVSVAGYYSGVDTHQFVALDTNGQYTGFGFPSSSNSNNTTIKELTLTGSLLSFKSENRGSAQINLQYSWLERKPFDTGTGPSSATMHMFLAQVRYNLP